MFRRSNLVTAAGCLIALIFFLGIWQLFAIRFGAGDIYPAYSTLRADPLGAKVFFDSCRQTGRFQVRRNHGPLTEIPSGKDLTLFYLGAREAAFLGESLRASAGADPLNRLILNGARLVAAFVPGRGKGRQPRAAGDKKENSKDGDDGGRRNPAPCRDSGPDRLEKWDVSIIADTLAPKKGERTAHLWQASKDTGLPHRMPWHSNLSFRIRSARWEPVYTFGGRPVVIRRRLGRGEIILMADTFPLSNEAMKTDRSPELLSWLMGPRATLVFDETHLGIRKKPGVAMLIRENRLHWPFLGIVLTALFFVWKNAVPLVPPPKPGPDGPNRGASSARDHTQGLIGLLRRNVPPAEILNIMVDQWLSDLPPDRRVSDSGRRRIRALAGGGSPLKKASDSRLRAAYAAIYNLITERTRDGD